MQIVVKFKIYSAIRVPNSESNLKITPHFTEKADEVIPFG